MNILYIIKISVKSQKDGIITHCLSKKMGHSVRFGVSKATKGKILR
jgi:hypothetical protein